MAMYPSVKVGGGTGDWEFYDVKPSTTTEYPLPSDFKAISVFITKSPDFGYRMEASRAEIDKIIDSRIQNGSYIQYGYDSVSAVTGLIVRKSGNNYTYGAMRIDDNHNNWGNSAFNSYIFLK